MMRCPWAQTLMIKQLRTPLAEGERERLAGHLELCADCRSAQAELRDCAAALRQGGRPAVPTASGARPPLAVLTAGALNPCRPMTGIPVTGWQWVVPAGAAALAVAIGVPGLRPPYRRTGGAVVAVPNASMPPSVPVPSTSLGPQRQVASANPKPMRSSPVRKVSHISTETKPAAPGPDSEFLDGWDPALAARWTGGKDAERRLREWARRRLPSIQDDFVQIPFPLLATADPQSPALRDAVKQYEQDAKVVDSRLFRQVTLRLKESSLERLCAELEKQTQVRLRPSRGVQDEKVTVFVKETRARDVMREVARLFGYTWERSGEDGAYRYELRQDLRAQLREEELRNQDVHEALAALDEDLARYRPYLDLTPEQIKTRLERAQGAEKDRLTELAGPMWGPIQVYHRLSPAQLQALGTGQFLEFSTGASSPDHQLPAAWRLPLLRLSRLAQGSLGGTPVLSVPEMIGGGTPLTQVTGAEAQIALHVEQPELGQFKLSGGIGGTAPGGLAISGLAPGAAGSTLATGKSPSVAPPGNAALNAKLRGTSPFQQQVSIRPRPSCPQFVKKQGGAGHELPASGDPNELLYFDGNGQLRNGIEPPHVSRGDVWEAIHEATGLPLIADAYSHQYDAKQMTLEKTSTFDGLCRLADAMGVRWQKDGAFLLARSTAFFWDKLKEVPERSLRRWQEARLKNGYLPLDALAEMAACSDAQLDAVPVGQVISHCRGLEEWGLVGPLSANFRPGLPTGKSLRPYCRFLALLNSAQLAAAQGAAGLVFADLTGPQQAALVQAAHLDGSPQDLPALRVRVDYVPVGAYLWMPGADTSEEAEALRQLGLIRGKNAAETLAAARRAHPAAKPEEVQRSRGVLVFAFSNPRTGAAWSYGAPAIGIRINQ